MFTIILIAFIILAIKLIFGDPDDQANGGIFFVAVILAIILLAILLS